MTNGKIMHDQVADKLEAYISEQRLLEAERLVVGFSGGPDSTALLLLLRDYWPSLTAVHLNHGLRGEDADHDELWCKRFCRLHEIAYQSARIRVDAQRQAGESTEMVSRRLRLDYWRREMAGATVLLGHHRDDAVETALLRFCRGCNCSGLYGLRPKAEIDGVKIERPMLCLTRMEIDRFLRAEGVTDYRIDKTNRDQTFLRNRVRHELLPLLQDIAGGPRALYRTLDFLQQDASLLEQIAAEVPVEDLDVARLEELNDALFPRVLRNWLAQQAGRTVQPGDHAIDRLKVAIRQPQHRSVLVDLNGDFFIRVAGGQLFLEEKTGPELTKSFYWRWAERSSLRIPQLGIVLTAEVVGDHTDDPDAEYFDFAALTPTLIVRPRKPGDRMVPFASQHPKKLKKLISDKKLSSRLKRELFLVCTSDDDIIWVPGVRRSEHGRVKSGSRIVRIRVIRDQE